MIYSVLFPFLVFCYPFSSVILKCNLNWKYKITTFCFAFYELCILWWGPIDRKMGCGMCRVGKTKWDRWGGGGGIENFRFLSADTQYPPLSRQINMGNRFPPGLMYTHSSRGSALGEKSPCTFSDILAPPPLIWIRGSDICVRSVLLNIPSLVFFLLLQ